ncbi:MAG: class I SAM-dependent DNA methyltransferase [Candidatus Cloacimonetes bacterium]|nr:class I SAM-dependent DNA methyltransferase [Candidatus Cloacimonadota bacterium]
MINIKKLENDLWEAADQLRANSKLTASEYSMPVLGLIFLRHAYNRFIVVKAEIEKNLPEHPERGKRPVNKNDFLARNAMYLPESAQFDFLVHLSDEVDTGGKINQAMKDIEEEYDTLSGVLPRNYTIFSNELLRELLRIFNREALQKVNGDVFGKIYEFFLNKFAMTGAQEGGEFFTPFSLVNTIVNVIEPDHGVVLDPAVGSAGMFVQTGYFIENEGFSPAEKVTFFGQEKTETNTKLAKMNLAVHGLQGNILEGNTFYADKHDLVGACDFVMANPPFNVDGVDKNREFVKNDPRLPFGLPKNDNANYLWIQYFYSYLKPTGRAGFVMSSAASDAGHSEKDLRRKLVETGAVDVMLAIGNNFFYTRSLPCTLWFFDRAKEKDPDRKNKILMLDARKIFRKVTQKINDFSPEQLRNLMCVVHLYRGDESYFQTTRNEYIRQSIQNAQAAAKLLDENVSSIQGSSYLNMVCLTVIGAVKREEDQKLLKNFSSNLEELLKVMQELAVECHKVNTDDFSLDEVAAYCKEQGKTLTKLLKLYSDSLTILLRELKLQRNKEWDALNAKDLLTPLRPLNHKLFGNPDEGEPGLLHDVEYFWKQAHWLEHRFPEGKYADYEGLCKVVTRDEVAGKDYSLSPGRYVGVDAAMDEDIDYEERLKEIHINLAELNKEAEIVFSTITVNFADLNV